METCNRTQSTDRQWPYLLAAAAGTLLLALASGAARTNGTYTADAAVAAIHLKSAATVLLLLIVPAVWARLAHRISPWVLLGLAGFAFVCGWIVRGDAVSALYTTLLIALPGAGLFGLQKLKLSNFRTVLYESFVILAALFAFLCLGDLIGSGDAFLKFRQLAALYGQVLGEIDFSAFGANGALLSATMREAIDLLRLNPEALFAPMLLGAAMAAGLSNTLFSHLFNRNGGVTLSVLPPFERWRCERWFVLLSAGFLLASLALGMAGVESADALSGVAGVLWRMPCMLAGLCTVRYLGSVSGKKWVFWLAIGALLVLPPAMIVILAMIGVLASLRKPIDAGEDGIRK